MQTKKSNFGALASLFLIVFIDLLGLSLVIPILAPLFLSPTGGLFPAITPEPTRLILLGILLATFPLAQFFGAPLLGALSDKYGRKKLLIISLIGTFIGYILFGLGIIYHHLYLMIIGRLIDGFTGGNIAIAQSAIADLSDEKTKARNFGLIGMAFGLGFIIGPYAGGKLSDPSLVSWFNFATPIWFAAILTIINIILIIITFKETLTVRREAPISLLTGFKNINKAFRMPHLRIMFIIVFLHIFGFNFFTQFFQVSLIKRFQFNQSQIGDTFAFVGLFIALTQGVLIRPISKRFKPEQILKVTIIIVSIALFALIIPTKAFWIFLILPIMAICNGLTWPNYLSIISNLSAKDSQGEILGINQSMQSLAFAIPPLIAGFIAQKNIHLPTIIGSICIAIAWVIFIMFFSRKFKEGLFKEV